jgi:hypothetical protein
MPIPLKIVLTATLCATALACESASPFELEDIVGLHGLLTVSGQDLPFVRREGKADPSCIQGGVTGDMVDRINHAVLELAQDHSFTLTFHTLKICTYPTGVSTNQGTLRATGSFTISGETMVLNPSDGGWERMEAVRRGDGIAIYTMIPGDYVARTYVFGFTPFG